MSRRRSFKFERIQFPKLDCVRKWILEEYAILARGTVHGRQIYGAANYCCSGRGNNVFGAMSGLVRTRLQTTSEAVTGHTFAGHPASRTALFKIIVVKGNFHTKYSYLAYCNFNSR